MDLVLSVSKLGELYFYFPRTHVHIFIWTVNNSRVVWEHNRWTIGGRAMYQCNDWYYAIVVSREESLDLQEDICRSRDLSFHLVLCEKQNQKIKWKYKGSVQAQVRPWDAAYVYEALWTGRSKILFLYLSNSKCYLYLLVFNRNTSFSSF